jgi:amino acid transporter
VVMALAIWGIADPGPGGLNVTSFDPTNAPSARGLYRGVVFTIFAFAGWEALAPLAEEARRPRRSVPIAIVGAIVLVGVFMVISSWGLVVGWGTDRVGTLAGSPGFPPFALARQLWGGAWIVVLAAFLNSVLAVSVACTTASSRMWYAMARSGSLPRWLAYVHARYRTPVAGVAAQAVIALGVGLGLGFWLGPRDEFITLGLVTVLSLALVYASGNVGVFRFYVRARRAEFNLLLHVLLPLVSTVALAWAAFKTFDPLPQTPYRYAPVAVGIWLAIGVLLLWAMHRRGRERWLHEAAQSLDL